MIRDIFRECSITKDELLKRLTRLYGGLRADIEVRNFEGGTYGVVRVNDELICDVRVNEVMCEYYLKIKDINYLDYLSKSGFKELAELIRSYSGSYPSEIAISKVMSSRSIYILMSSRDVPKAFPSIRVTYRENFFEVSSSYCRLSVDEDTCKFLNELLNIAKKYWLEMFR